MPDFVDTLRFSTGDGDAVVPRYICQPFENEPDFTVTSVNFNLAKLLARAQPPF